MIKDEIKAGDRINTPKGMGTVKYAFGSYLTVMLDNGEWWVNMNAILPKEDNPKDNTITIPVKADFGEDVGFALLDRALELQKKYTELEGEIKRLYELVNDAMNGLHPLRLKFDNCFLSGIACMVCCDFRPLTEEEKKQINVDIKNMADNLKKQSE